jgi:hypothetical protein
MKRRSHCFVLASVTLLADPERLRSPRNWFGYTSPHQIYGLRADGRLVISYEQLTGGEARNARTALVIGLTVAPLVSLVCLGGYALYRRQRRGFERPGLKPEA